MIALLIATREEASVFLERLAARPVAETPFPTWAFSADASRPGGVVVITGMGPTAAAAATRHVISDRGASIVINVGLCGSLSPDLTPGDIVRITDVTNSDPLAEDCPAGTLQLSPAQNWHEFPEASLTTVKEPVFGGKQREILAADADVVDMEGVAIAAICAEFGRPCHMLKVISDTASEGGRKDLQANLVSCMAVLADVVVPGLASFHQPPRSLIAKMLSFVKFEHTLFSLPLLFAGAWIAAGQRLPSTRILVLIAIAGVGARTLGMATNRILDRHLDLLNPRTAGRELPSGSLSVFQGLAVAAGGLAVYLAACMAISPLCLLLSPIPALVLATYSLLKRFTWLCHFGIGACLMLGPLGAHVAVSGSLKAPIQLVALAFFTFFWISGADIVYSLQDLPADRETGVHSIPVRFGAGMASAIAVGVHALALGMATLLWYSGGCHPAAGAALGTTALTLAFVHVPALPLAFRFFPISAIAGLAGAFIPLLGGPQ